MARIFALGDPHLSRARPKPMDVFGDQWTNHGERIFAACREVIEPDDLLIFAGDISWATRLDEALPDLEDIGALPGSKLLLKGNHDFWWTSRQGRARARSVREAAAKRLDRLRRRRDCRRPRLDASR
ncbi:MAG: metallophosphoesterase [Blastocatellia bacterium]|nr:metallophosphoesterase [Blastocatellia bacterium]